LPRVRPDPTSEKPHLATAVTRHQRGGFLLLESTQFARHVIQEIQRPDGHSDFAAGVNGSLQRLLEMIRAQRELPERQMCPHHKRAYILSGFSKLEA